MFDRRQLLSYTRDQVLDMIDWSPSHSRQIWLSNRCFHRERSKHMSCWCSSHTPSPRAGMWSWWIHLNFRSFQTCRRQKNQCRLYPWCCYTMARIVLWSTLMRICTVIRCENPTLERQLHYLSQKSQRDSSLEDFSTTSYSLHLSCGWVTSALIYCFHKMHKHLCPFYIWVESVDESERLGEKLESRDRLIIYQKAASKQLSQTIKTSGTVKSIEKYFDYESWWTFRCCNLLANFSTLDPPCKSEHERVLNIPITLRIIRFSRQKLHFS